MLDLVDIGERPLEQYRGITPDALLDQVRQAARAVAGARILHVNATPYGGGVSEILRSMVPLLNDLGLKTEWRIVTGDEAFFEVTKAIHNGLQGAKRPLSDKERATYLASARANSAALLDGYDFVFVHDPQPAALLAMHGKGSARWIWRCHIDTSTPNLETWAFLRPFLVGYDAAIFTMAQFVPRDLPVDRLEIVPPAIDPLSPKNLPLERATAERMLEWIGVRTRRPLVTQVARFDPWKDPLGVIAAYRLVREEIPDLQLAMIGSIAHDDPEGLAVYRQIRDATASDPEVHVFTNLTGVGNVEVNAFQSLSQVMIQKSVKEGFGLVVSEALWKGTPVVAGRAGGIPLQMADGAGGVLVDSVEECARGVLALLRDPERARALGAAGRARVRDRFLMPRLLLNELELLRELSAPSTTVRAARRDPVCGLALQAGEPIDLVLDGVRHRFCSQGCRAAFLARSAALAGDGSPAVHLH